jgi:hypothetical protein
MSFKTVALNLFTVHCWNSGFLDTMLRDWNAGEATRRQGNKGRTGWNPDGEVTEITSAHVYKVFVSGALW